MNFVVCLKYKCFYFRNSIEKYEDIQNLKTLLPAHFWLKVLKILAVPAVLLTRKCENLNVSVIWSK